MDLEPFFYRLMRFYSRYNLNDDQVSSETSESRHVTLSCMFVNTLKLASLYNYLLKVNCNSIHSKVIATDVMFGMQYIAITSQ